MISLFLPPFIDLILLCTLSQLPAFVYVYILNAFEMDDLFIKIEGREQISYIQLFSNEFKVLYISVTFSLL